MATQLKVPFLYHVVDERSERDHLLYKVDSVSRLAQAQMAAVLHQQDCDFDWKEQMAEERFIEPGVLWWAFDPVDARKQAGRFFRPCPVPEPLHPWSEVSENAPCGSVVLIDEIDKADPSVPNGLLECLGNQGFRTAQLGRAVELKPGAKPPFVMITTNEERELPAAFLRRCLVLEMQFPPADTSVTEFLRRRARVYWGKNKVSDEILDKMAKALETDRDNARTYGLAKPGAAEFLDLARVLVTLHPGDADKQREALAKVQRFAYRKNPARDLR